MRTFTLLLFPGLLLAQTELKWGTAQTTILTGFNLRDARAGAQPSVALGVDVGLTRLLALTTAYSWNREFGEGVSGFALGRPFKASENIALHDLMGGVRMQIPTEIRLTPYLSALVGMTQAREVLTVNGRHTRDTVTKPAAGAGFGLEVWIGKGWSVVADARAIRPLDFYWYGRCAFGVSYRAGKTRHWDM